MTVAATYTPQQFTGDGVTRTFSFPYQYFTPSDLAVTLYNPVTASYVTTPVLNGSATYDYTVTGTQDSSGTQEYLYGTVTFVTAPASGLIVRIARAVPATQGLSMTPFGPFPAKSIEAALDRMAILAQQVATNVSTFAARAVSIPVTDTTGTSVTLPPAAQRANQYLLCDASGNVTTGLPLVGTASVSSAMQPVIASVSLAAARNTLSIVPGVTPEQYGAVGDGVTNDTVAIQLAINAVAAAGGGKVWFGAKTYLITSNALYILSSNVQLQGSGQFATVLKFQNGALDCIVIQGPGGGSYINGNGVRDLSITCAGKTGGRAMFLTWLFNAHVERVYVNNCWTGFDVLHINTVTVRDVSFSTIAGGVGAWGIYYHAVAPNLSIELYLDNVLINPQWSGADGVLWDGPAYTLDAYHLVLLDVRIGLWVRNTAASSVYYPEYFEGINFVVDGASLVSVQIEGGGNFHFTGCEIQNNSGEAFQGSADAYAVFILADTGHSETHEVYFSNCNIGASRLTAVETAAHDVTFSNCRFGSAPTTVSNTVPGVSINAPASDTLIIGCRFSYYGSPGGWNYGVSFGAGTFRSFVTGCHFNVGCVQGAVYNASGDPSSISNDYIGPPASAPGPFVGLPIYTAAPANPRVSEAYFNNTTGHAQMWDGSAWQNLW